MKTNLFKLLFALTVLSFYSCSNSSDENTTPINNEKRVIGIWKISKYIIVNRSNGSIINNYDADCSKNNEYTLKDGGGLQIKMYRKDVNDNNLCKYEGQEVDTWIFDSTNDLIKMFPNDSQPGIYKIKSLTENEMQLINFDEGYVEYEPNKDYDNDGKVDDVITVLVK